MKRIGAAPALEPASVEHGGKTYYRQPDGSFSGQHVKAPRTVLESVINGPAYSVLFGGISAGLGGIGMGLGKPPSFGMGLGKTIKWEF